MRTVLSGLVLFLLLGCAQQSAQEPAKQAAAQPAPAAAMQPVEVAKTQPAPAMPTTSAAPAPQKPGTPTPPAKPIEMKDSALGVVTFDHAKHKLDCATCHHPSKPEKAAAKPQEAC